MLKGKFASSGLNANDKILVALSGGGDSLALLHLLHRDMGADRLIAATVDHGLRPESASEAEQAAKWCGSLGVAHQILRWAADGTSSQSARMGRYKLLIACAREVGAKTIALGHTIDDQAETLLMRAQRMTPASSTRGMAGMAEWTTHDGIRLWRPLLDTRRSELRAYLRSRKFKWIDDPSNKNLASERIRARQVLAMKQNELPPSESIARLARLSGATRNWLDNITARAISKNVSIEPNNKIRFAPTPRLPLPVTTDCLSLLILAVGELPHRPSQGKIEDVADWLMTGKTNRKAVGRCLISVNRGTATLEREERRHQLSGNYFACGVIDPETEAKSCVAPLEQFRSFHDEASYHALKSLLDSAPHSSFRSI